MVALRECGSPGCCGMTHFPPPMISIGVKRQRKKDGAGNVCQGEEDGVSEAGTRARCGGACQSQ